MGKVYPQEFRDQVAALYREGERSYSELAREIGVSPTTVKNWVEQAQRDAGERSDGLVSSEHDELVALRFRVVLLT